MATSDAARRASTMRRDSLAGLMALESRIDKAEDGMAGSAHMAAALGRGGLEDAQIRAGEDRAAARQRQRMTPRLISVNVSWTVDKAFTKDDIKALLTPFGRVKHIKVSSLSKGRAVVTFRTEQSVGKALIAPMPNGVSVAPGKTAGNNKLLVAWADKDAYDEDSLWAIFEDYGKLRYITVDNTGEAATRHKRAIVSYVRFARDWCFLVLLSLPLTHSLLLHSFPTPSSTDCNTHTPGTRAPPCARPCSTTASCARRSSTSPSTCRPPTSTPCPRQSSCCRSTRATSCRRRSWRRCTTSSARRAARTGPSSTGGSGTTACRASTPTRRSGTASRDFTSAFSFFYSLTTPPLLVSLSRLYLLSSSSSSCRYGVTVEGGRVVRLELAGNNLVGQLPESIGAFKALRALWLQHNEIEGAVPFEVGQLTELHSLYLQRNRLKRLPPSIDRLTKLELLGLLENNWDVGGLPDCLEFMDSLKIDR